MNRINMIIKLIGNNKFDEALNQINLEMNNSPNDSLLFLMKGQCYNGLDNFKEAEKNLDKSLHIDQQNGLAWLEKSKLYLKMEYYEKAFTCLNLAENCLPDPTIVLYFKGDLAVEMKDYENALNIFNEILHLNPTDEDCYFKKGFCLMQLERFNEAIACFDTVLEIDDTNNFDFIAFKYRITCFTMIGQLEHALSDSDFIKKEFDVSNDEDYWMQRSMIFFSKNMIEESLKCLNKSIEINPTFLPALQMKNSIINGL